MSMQVVKYNFPSETHFAIETLADDASQLIEKRLIGVSGWAENARRLVASHASHDNTVNLEGEPGTGKAFLAALIHQCSARREGPFVSLTFGSASADVACSVLFGSSQTLSPEEPRGEEGLIELARGGTLYVKGLSDSASSLVEHIVNLLRQSRFNNRREDRARILLGWDIQPGSHDSKVPSDIRNVRGFESIAIPPLRERPDDIEALIVHFVKQRCVQTRKEVRTVSSEALNALRAYDWPRNVLELRTLVSRLVNQTRPPSIDVSLLPAYVRDRNGCEADLFPASGVDLSNEIKRREIELICAALKHSRGLQTKAARLLQIKATTLFMKIQRYGIDVEVFR
jgi:DNA-binding NtrC family response regulator